MKREGKLLTKKEYEQLVKDVRERVWPRKHSLGRYWEIGRRVSKLGNPPYGKAKIQKVAKDAGTNCVTVYQCRRFYECWPTKAELSELVEKKVPWCHVHSLVRPWLTDKDRQDLVKHIEKHRPTGRQLQDKVRAKVKAKKKNRRWPPGE